MKLCVDCKHYQSWENEGEDRCKHPDAVIGGVRALRVLRCESMRAGICGTDARLFEPAREVANV